ncbi:hypothetical protein [Sporosarcina sp. JAI121]|uniref:TcaA NTF2-like domain-containing protein n=1 Tax=Sporosarcina sp. JAI121 TaxID=2723064 RepID=UPI0015CD3BB4|nr:hypothetical protein [Sporosarcina sp. JAI121]NYF23578.1 putative membrane protein YvbJ [Sporosarcina sp. JAI121]
MSKFCIECGSTLKVEERFCPSCGVEQRTPAEQTIVEEVLPKRTVEKAQKEKMSVGRKVLLSLALVIIATVAVGHLTIKSMTEPDKTVLPIFNAILDGNEAEFFANLTMPKDVEYDAKAYISHVANQQMDHFQKTVMEAANHVWDDGITRVVKHEDGSELFRLKEKKFFYLYPTVEVIPIGSDVQLETDITGAQISLNKKEYELNGENIELGTFLPGSYNMEVTTENAIIPNSAMWPIPITTNEKVNLISLLNDDFMVSLDGDQLDSIVFVNGKSTEKPLSELQKIGPIFSDTEVKVFIQKETPTGELAKSNEEIVTIGSDVYLSYPSDVSFVVKTPEEIAEETFDRNDLGQFVIGFRDAYQIALNNKDFAIIEPYLAPGSIASKEIKDFIGDIGNEYYNYNFTRNEVRGIELKVDEASVKTYEEFYFTNHKNDVIFYERDKQYDIQMDANGDFKVYKIHISDTKRNR